MTTMHTENSFRKFTEQEQQAIQKLFRSGAITPLLQEAADKVKQESDDLQKRTAVTHEALQRPLSTV